MNTQHSLIVYNDDGTQTLIRFTVWEDETVSFTIDERPTSSSSWHPSAARTEYRKETW